MRHLALAPLLLLPALAHASVPAAEALVPTSLAGVSSYLPAPETFEPAQADAATLAAYGFPPRPDPHHAAGAYRSWRLAVEGVERIRPALQSVAIHHGPMIASTARDARSENGTAATSSNWSGYVVAAAAFNFGAQSITDIYGDWVVPVAQTAFDACHHKTTDLAVYSSTWVGIDGDGSGDVLQAGTESDATCSMGTQGAYQGAWYEWYPYNEVRVTNLPITPGGAVYVHVWASSATRGHAYIADKSNHKAVSIAFDAPPNTHLLGNSAEWIVERPLVNGVLANLTNYVQEFFADAEATDASGHAYYPGIGQVVGQQPALQIDMADETNQIISVPTLIGANAIWFMDQGTANRIPKG